MPRDEQTISSAINAPLAIPVSAITIRNLPEPAQRTGKGGIDFEKLAHDKAALGIAKGGPVWTEAMDDPALSRRVLGLDPA